jgi:hypothetical protein
MKIPKRVKIGAIYYKVKIVKEWGGYDGADAQTFYDKPHGNIIYLNSELTQSAMEIAFIHEAYHCMNSTMNHEFLDSLSEQTYSFLIENDLLK